MSLNPTYRSAINIGVPAVIAGTTAILLLRSGKGWKFILIAAGIAFLITWIVVKQVTNVAAAAGPPPVPTGGGCDSYDPKSLIDAIYQDLTCTFCYRQYSLYDTLLGLSDCQLRTAYNYWNANYYGTVGNKSLPVMIAEQTSFVYQFDDVKTSVAAKFSTLSLQ